MKMQDWRHGINEMIDEFGITNKNPLYDMMLTMSTQRRVYKQPYDQKM